MMMMMITTKCWVEYDDDYDVVDDDDHNEVVSWVEYDKYDDVDAVDDDDDDDDYNELVSWVWWSCGAIVLFSIELLLCHHGSYK